MAGSEVEQPITCAVQAERAGWRHSGNADRRRRRVLCATGVIAALAGCSDKGATSTDWKVASLESRLDTLQTSVSNLRDQVKSMSGDQVALLTPGSDGFTYLSNGTVSVTASLSGLEQAGSGVKARFQIGNLTAGELVKCWSYMNVRKTKDGDFEEGTVQYFTGNLKPGSFNQTSTLLPDLKVAEVSAIRLSSLLCERVLLNK